MDTIQIDGLEPNETRNIEIWVNGHRRITLSLNSKYSTLQIPGGLLTLSDRPNSFYAKSKDYD